MQLPKYITIQLTTAFKNTVINNDGWFPIHNEKTNDWLFNHLPISCGWEREEFILNNSFKVYFNFAIDRFYVST